MMVVSFQKLSKAKLKNPEAKTKGIPLKQDLDLIIQLVCFIFGGEAWKLLEQHYERMITGTPVVRD